MIKKFLNIHKNKDLYVIASGKSLDFFNFNFFDDKTSIGINQIYKKIKTNYVIIKDNLLLKEAIDHLQNDQFLFVSKGNFGNSNELNKKYIEENNKETKKIIVFEHQNNNHRVEKLPTNPEEIIVSHSTITSGIHLAAYMGAKNIILVGHDCGSINKQFNCSSYHNDQTYKIAWKNGLKDYKKWTSTIEQDTINLKKLLIEKYGCNVYSLNPFINFGLEGNSYQKFKEFKLIL